jgi:23S rRNA (cytosine1962-C5)-methyltransferase
LLGSKAPLLEKRQHLDDVVTLELKFALFAGAPGATGRSKLFAQGLKVVRVERQTSNGCHRLTAPTLRFKPHTDSAISGWNGCARQRRLSASACRDGTAADGTEAPLVRGVNASREWSRSHDRHSPIAAEELLGTRQSKTFVTEKMDRFLTCELPLTASACIERLLTPTIAVQALLNAIAQVSLPSDAQRIFHGRGGLYPGCESWTLDSYPPVWLLTCYRSASEQELAEIGQALSERWHAIAPQDSLTWVYQNRGGPRVETRVMTGAIPQPHVVNECGLAFRVHLERGQNHGLFLDMAAGRRRVHELVCARPGLSVLNLFSYTCAFSVRALVSGAGRVVNVDMSAGALAIGQVNHQLNGVSAGASFMAHDVFKSWGKLTRSGPYDLVIVDPPSYQKGSFVAGKDYARVVRRLPSLVRPGGHALLCLNAPELPPTFLLDLVAHEAPGFRLIERVANPAVFADHAPDRALKVMLFAHDSA